MHVESDGKISTLEPFIELFMAQPLSPKSSSNFLDLWRESSSFFTSLIGRYERPQSDIIIGCIKVQEQILFTLGLDILREEDGIIAFSLQLLAFICDLSDLDHLDFFLYQDYSPEELLDRAKSHKNNKSFEVSECPNPKIVRGGKTLSSRLQDVLRISQRILFKKDPHNWPSILCVGYLLYLAGRESSSFISDEWVYECINPFMTLYHVRIEGHHPLKINWEPTKCASTFESSRHSQAYNDFMLFLHERWNENGTFKIWFIDLRKT